MMQATNLTNRDDLGHLYTMLRQDLDEVIMREARADGSKNESSPSAYFAFQAELVHALSAAGVPLLIGKDTPNPLVVPGFSIHHELRTLVAAGLSRANVLRAATIRAADRLGWKDQGRIAPGQVADLVLLDGNSFASLEPLRRPVGVIAAGQ